MNNFEVCFKIFWNSLSKEQQAKVREVHDYFMSNGIIGNAFAALKTHVNIL